jgi:hypothetical protein
MRAAGFVAVFVLALPAAAQAHPYLSLVEAWLATQKETRTLYHHAGAWGVGSFSSWRTDCERRTRTIVDCGWREVTHRPPPETKRGTECRGTMRVRMTPRYKILANRLPNTTCRAVVFFE